RALRPGRRGRARDRGHRADRPRRARGEGGAGDEHRGGVVDGRRDPARGGMTARLTVYALVAAIFVASLLLWLATPLVGLWLVSKLSDDGLVVVFAAVGIVCPLLMLAFGLVIGRLNGAYLRAVGAHPVRRAAAWPSSLSGWRVPVAQAHAVLERRS